MCVCVCVCLNDDTACERLLEARHRGHTHTAQARPHKLAPTLDEAPGWPVACRPSTMQWMQIQKKTNRKTTNKKQRKEQATTTPRRRCFLLPLCQPTTFGFPPSARRPSSFFCFISNRGKTFLQKRAKERLTSARLRWADASIGGACRQSHDGTLLTKSTSHTSNKSWPVG